MSSNCRLIAAIQRYKTAIELLTVPIVSTNTNQPTVTESTDITQAKASEQETNKQLTPAQILEVLTARDEVQAALVDTTQTSGESLATIAELDKVLKKNAGAIAISRKAGDWQNSFNPSKEAWWWLLEPAKAPVKFWDRFDWLWSAVSVASLTISLGLVGDISSRLLTGGPDTLGALTVSTQSVLTLLTAGGALTQAGQEAYKRILKNWEIPEQFWHEISAGCSVLLVIGLFGFRLSLPEIATLYSNWGFQNYQQGDWGSAQENYQRALSLNPDDAMAHFRLGLLYEEFQKLDLARNEYQSAVQNGILPAVNNLARLHILNKNYSAAVQLLLKALDSQYKQKSKDDKTKYAILKNLGWARLKQENYPDAQAKLLEAIDLRKSPKLKDKLKENIAAPHCLLAQVIEGYQGDKGDKKAALPEWENCIKYANSLNPDEDGWVITAQKRLAGKDTSK